MPICFKVSITASSLLSYYTTSIHIQLRYRNSYNNPKRSENQITPVLVHLCSQLRDTASPEKCNKLSPEGIYFFLLKRQGGWKTDFNTRLQFQMLNFGGITLKLLENKCIQFQDRFHLEERIPHGNMTKM